MGQARRRSIFQASQLVASMQQVQLLGLSGNTELIALR